MKSWPVQDAKATGPQIVTRHGAEAAVLVPMTDWQTLKRAIKPTLKELLLPDAGRGELIIPPRGGVLGLTYALQVGSPD